MTRIRRLVLVRHGETVGQSSIRYYGATDLELSDLGLQQMRAVGSTLLEDPFDLILTSGMRRTLVAADLIAPRKTRRAVAGFNEIDFGTWEGLTKEEIAERDPEGFARWQGDLHNFVYPGGDSVPAFRTRVWQAWQEIAADAPERVLLIAHRGVLLTILSNLLGLTDDQRANWPTALGSIHVLSHDSGRWTATRVNEVPPLAMGA